MLSNSSLLVKILTACSCIDANKVSENLKLKSSRKATRARSYQNILSTLITKEMKAYTPSTINASSIYIRFKFYLPQFCEIVSICDTISTDDTCTSLQKLISLPVSVVIYVNAIFC